MAENYTPQNVQTFVNDTSAVNTVNNNFAAISTAFTDVLSRSGVSPNTMLSTLDMNNNQIINLPPPATINSPARLIDISGGQITVVTATTGTSGHTVPFLDGTNTWSAQQNITTPSGLDLALNVNQTVSGNTGGLFSANQFQISDVANATSNFVNGLFVNQVFGQSSAQGGRQAIFGQANLVAATNAVNPNRNYVGISGIGLASSSDGGSGVTSVTAQGGIFGGGFQGNAGSSATNLLGVIGAEFNTNMASGSSAWSKALASFSSSVGDTVNGAVINTMLWLYNQGGVTSKWTNAILIDNGGGLGSFPISSSGTIIKTGAGSCANGIDFTNVTFSGVSFASPGFSISSTGTVSSGTAGFSNGVVLLNGSTSGSLTISSNATGNLCSFSQPIQVGVNGATAGQINIAGLTSGSAQISASTTGGTLQLGGNNLTINSSGALSTTNQITISNATAVPAGGSTTVGYLATTTANLGIFFGSGAPTLTAAQGSVYIRTDGSSTSTRLYVNTTGSNVWTNFTSAA